jgi:hypothetical protein
MTESVGRLLGVVFECADPAEQGRFWEAGLGYTRHHDRPEWVTIADPMDTTRRLSFQGVEDHVAPTWPERDRPQQAHVDLLVADLDEADARVVALGGADSPSTASSMTTSPSACTPTPPATRSASSSRPIRTW